MINVDIPCTVSCQDVLEAGELAKLAFYNDIVVGGVCCRVDTSSQGKKVGILMFQVKLYFYDNNTCAPALHHDPGLSGSLQTSRHWNQDVGTRPQRCQGGRQLLIHLPPRPDQ